MAQRKQQQKQIRRKLPVRIIKAGEQLVRSEFMRRLSNAGYKNDIDSTLDDFINNGKIKVLQIRLIAGSVIAYESEIDIKEGDF